MEAIGEEPQQPTMDEEFTAVYEDEEFDFNCPQFTDFSRDDLDNEEENADGYFAVRRSSVGVDPSIPHPSARRLLQPVSVLSPTPLGLSQDMPLSSASSGDAFGSNEDIFVETTDNKPNQDVLDEVHDDTSFAPVSDSPNFGNEDIDDQLADALAAQVNFPKSAAEAESEPSPTDSAQPEAPTQLGNAPLQLPAETNIPAPASRSAKPVKTGKQEKPFSDEQCENTIAMMNGVLSPSSTEIRDQQRPMADVTNNIAAIQIASSQAQQTCNQSNEEPTADAQSPPGPPKTAARASTTPQSVVGDSHAHAVQSPATPPLLDAPEVIVDEYRPKPVAPPQEPADEVPTQQPPQKQPKQAAEKPVNRRQPPNIIRAQPSNPSRGQPKRLNLNLNGLSNTGEFSHGTSEPRRGRNPVKSAPGAQNGRAQHPRPRRSNTPTYLNGTKSSTARTRFKSASPSAGRRSKSRTNSFGSARGSIGTYSQRPAVASTTTVAKTPALETTQRTRMRQHEPKLSSTSLELKRISEERKIMAAKRQQDQRRLSQLTERSNRDDSSSVGSNKTVTRATAPTFRSSMRPGAARAQKLKEDRAKLSAMKKRRATISNPGMVTRPEPFTFESDKRLQVKRKLNNLSTDATVSPASPSGKEEFVPLAAQVQSFLTKTPSRFRSNASAASTDGEDHHGLQLTEPETPRFATELRAKTRHDEPMKSTEELELEEIQKQEKFKAMPVNKKIMHSAGDLGVPKYPKKAPCKPQEFNFRTDKRAQARPSITSSKLVTGSSVYGSQVSYASSNGQRSHKSSKTSSSPLKPTVTKPFSFATDARAEHMHRSDAFVRKLVEDEREQQEHIPQFKARPIPNMNAAPSLPAPPRRETTKPEPFNLISVTKHEQYQQLRNMELERAREEEERKRQFKATRVKNSSTPQAIRSHRALTEPKTPAVLQRSNEAKARFEYKKLIEEEQEDQKRHFQAIGLPETTFRQDFVPAKTNHRFVYPDQVQLNSDDRAMKRSHFNNVVKEHIEEAQRRKHEEEVAKKLREDRELKEYRKSLVPRARPVPTSVYHPAPLKAPLNPVQLTDPNSPFLSTKIRLGEKGQFQ